MDEFGTDALVREGNYKDVVDMYQAAGDKEKMTANDYYNYAYSLRKLNRFKEGHQIAREGMIKFPEYNRIKRPYCWCLYYLYIKNFDPKKDNGLDFRKAVDSILKNSVFEQYSPYEIAIWKMLDYLKTLGTKEGTVQDMARYIALLNPDELSTEEKVYQVEGKRDIHSASSQEKWYLRNSYILFSAKQYEECITTCQTALDKINHPHNEVWFKYRIAQAEIQLDKLDKAEVLLNEILLQNKNWNFYHSLFTLCQKRQENELALKYGSAAMLADGKDESKVKLLMEFSTFLMNNNHKQEAFWHALYCKNIREEHGWAVSQKLEEEIKEFEMEPVDSKTLRQNLREFWKSNKHSGEELHHGRIDKYVSENKAGFIKEDNGKSYFFSTHNLQGKQEKFAVGTLVSFYVEDSFDHKKQVKSFAAVEIVLVE